MYGDAANAGGWEESDGNKRREEEREREREIEREREREKTLGRVTATYWHGNGGSGGSTVDACCHGADTSSIAGVWAVVMESIDT